MLKTLLSIGWTLAILSNPAYGELIEINRITAKVNDRIVTWGEIERAMDRLNFTDEEKKLRASEFVEGKIRATGSGISRFLNLQNNLFITVSCAKCGYTELYKRKTGKLGTVVDLFTN